MYFIFSFLYKPHLRIKISMVILLTMLITFIGVSLPYIFSYIIEILPHAHQESFIVVLAILLGYGITWILDRMLEQIRTLIVMYLMEGTLRSIHSALFDHLQRLSLQFHMDRQSGALISSIERAQFGIETLFWSLILLLIPLFIELIFVFIVISAWYGILAGFILLICTCAYIGIHYYMLEKTTIFYEQYNAARAKTSASFMDNLLNIETIHYFSNHTFEHNRYSELLRQQEQAGIGKHRVEALMQASQIVLVGLILTYTTLHTGLAVLYGKLKISDFILINGYVLRFIMPINHCAFALTQMRKALQDIQEIKKIMEITPTIIDTQLSQNLSANHAEIAFNNVWFTYDSKRPILQNISFTLPAGKTIAIVGPTGSGKSTIARLLFRFFDPISGSISINGQDIRSYTQESLHKAIGMVSQDAVLFNNTIYFNIAYGNLSASKQEVEQAARDAQLEDFIKRLPEEYDTVVGERGLKLSGGEKQRIAIARVLLKKPLIYIFDEATSSLDSNTEYEIQKTIAQLSFDKTTFIIAHRLSTIMHADSILVLENGNIVEQGNHFELLTQQNLYAKLWYKQLKH